MAKREGSEDTAPLPTSHSILFGGKQVLESNFSAGTPTPSLTNGATLGSHLATGRSIFICQTGPPSSAAQACWED